MTRRRGHGEGAVYRRADGLWVGAVELGRDPRTGRRIRKVAKARTKTAVLARLAEIRGQLQAGAPVTDDRRTTGDYLTWWADNVLAGTVKESTAASYHWIIDHYLTPHVGHIPLSKLAPGDLQGMLKALEVDGKSARTRQYARAVLRRALGHAEHWDLIPRNAATLVDAPRGAGAKLDDALTATEAQAVLAQIAGDRLEALATLALTLGLRRGELLALRWGDIDLHAGTLRVERTITRVPGRGLVVTGPKTEAGARTIPLVADTATALRAHRQRQRTERQAAGPHWVETGSVFTSEIGTPLDPANALHWWQTHAVRAGIGLRRLHASRHTAATLMLEAGVPLEVVSAVLGHAGLAITADIYARPTMDAKRRALTTLNDALDV